MNNHRIRLSAAAIVAIAVAGAGLAASPAEASDGCLEQGHRQGDRQHARVRADVPRARRRGVAGSGDAGDDRR